MLIVYKIDFWLPITMNHQMGKVIPKEATWKESSLLINVADFGWFIQYRCIQISAVSIIKWTIILVFFSKKLKTIFWNIFAANMNDYYYPETGMIYGQSFLCLSLSSEQIDLVGKQLIYNEPQIYETIFPQNLSTIYPNIQRLADGKRINNAPFWNEVDLKTLGGSTFKSFAKSSKFDKELYEDWVWLFSKNILFGLNLLESKNHFTNRLHQHWTLTFMWKHGAKDLEIFHRTAPNLHGKWSMKILLFLQILFFFWFPSIVSGMYQK